MKFEDFPKEIQPLLMPNHQGRPVYRCLGCRQQHSIEKLLYTCPSCGKVLLIEDNNFSALLNISGDTWRRIFDYRRMLNIPALKGIYRYHEFIGPQIPLENIIYLGEAHTPLVEANAVLQKMAGGRFFYKNDGQNPSASFKDRGMASAFSYINYLLEQGFLKDVLAVCASTGDTSAAAALYASYLQPRVKSAVLLPHKKVTPQQLSQPLGSGAKVFEIPGVFDDCMKVVEALSEQYNVALLNSKNAWRILGQESYSYEIAQDFEYDMNHKVVVLPIGNAGNITAVLNGFLKFKAAGIIETLPKIIGVQSEHANPVYTYYSESDPKKRKFIPMRVKPSVAQAAMIGNPVSMPRVIYLVDQYNQRAGKQKVFMVEVSEQKIMDWQLKANRNGHIACTHGGESLAGMVKARKEGIIKQNETAIIDSTAHAIKFSGFQESYFQNNLSQEFKIFSNPDLINQPVFVKPPVLKAFPGQGRPLLEDEFKLFVKEVTKEIAMALQLKKESA